MFLGAVLHKLVIAQHSQVKRTRWMYQAGCEGPFVSSLLPTKATDLTGEPGRGLCFGMRVCRGKQASCSHCTGKQQWGQRLAGFLMSRDIFRQFLLLWKCKRTKAAKDGRRLASIFQSQAQRFCKEYFCLLILSYT